MKTLTKVAIKQMLVDSSTIMDVHLQGSDGQAVWIRPCEI
jgi:hypothetical protein